MDKDLYIEFLENRICAGRDDEIQDLKLENDLLKRRDEIMLKFIRSVACINCNDSCVFFMINLDVLPVC